MKKYIFLDVDGTLLDTNTKEIPASAIEALKLAQNNGHKVYLCSGRTILEMKPFLHLELDGYICAAGGQIHQDNQIIFDYTFAEKDVDALMQFANEHNMNLKIETDHGSYLDPVTYDIFMRYFNYTLEKQMDNYHFYHLTHKVDRVGKMSIFYQNEEDVDVLKKQFPEYSFPKIPVKKDGMYYPAVECSHKTINKGKAVEKVMAYNNATMEQSIGIGDSLNDTELIKTAHIGIAMGNASDEIKNIANYITTDVDKDGIYNAFKHFEII
jgi:Cof subfamily protein (haloacid dehalogenase superfamily)